MPEIYTAYRPLDPCRHAELPRSPCQSLDAERHWSGLKATWSWARLSRVKALGREIGTAMPRYVHVPTDATPHLIRQAYEAGGAYQWAREGWRNSDESGATRIYFGLETQAAESRGVLRRTIIDNGAGMDPGDMRVFLTTFGGGGKPIGVDSNFGQGFKSSVLPWNPEGVVVISYTENTPDGAMLWIFRDSSGNYCLKEWEHTDQDGDVSLHDVVEPFDDTEESGCDWSKIRPEWLKTGTIMVMLGSSLAEDTIEGDPDSSREEGADGLVRYLNGRLFDVAERNGSKVETTVVGIENVRERRDRGGRDNVLTLPNGRQIALHQRKVQGMKSLIPDESLHGTVTVDAYGTIADWYFVPEPLSPVSRSIEYFSKKPVVAVDYQGEAYEPESKRFRYRQFGITDDISGRTWLIIRPPVYRDSAPGKWGVLTQASRNMLMVKGGGPLPWDEWGDAFFASFPDELAKAVADARSASTASNDPNTAKNLERILDRLNPRFKASRLMSSAFGKILGHPTGDKPKSPSVRPATSSRTPSATPTPGSGPSIIVTRGPDGTVAASSKGTKGGHPTYQWKPFDEDQSKLLADFSQKETQEVDGIPFSGVVYLNATHPVFTQEFDYWSSTVWPKADPAQVTQLVQKVYGEEVVAHVVHAQRLNGTVVGKDEEDRVVQIGPGDVEKLLEPYALSASLLGLVNVEQRILTQGGGLFGSRAS